MAAGLIVYLSLLAWVLVESRRLTTTTWTGRCTACRYDLHGLDRAAPCPECGAEKPGWRPADAHEYRFRTDRVWVVPLTLPAFGLLLVVQLRAEWFAAVVYWLDGFGWRGCLKAAAYRGERDVLPWVWLAAALLIPSPLVALIHHRRLATAIYLVFMTTVLTTIFVGLLRS